ncbi:DNA-binding transcriptional regulator, AcrR family [Nonomuraea maritima]|uniref:DNA-binding transcriptional regulator, AcrR family n=1 Tax=Nonomuraea maritima TaxID=683260 RepID=A0A1G9DG75_9ACTN|nr:helix-turn-helix domain-containing protein [Nonomuraea maritima]SDK62881.1 DNA-binding transcriptional regulator, AcrR family [Nonomuraea maritima]
MHVNEQEREQAILDAAAELLLRLGYNKLTMGDVADAVALHRGLVYLIFSSKDELVEAVMVRELDAYTEAWRDHVAADPRGGSAAGVYRAMVHALEELPLAAAIVARDAEVFGKYLRRPGNLFERDTECLGTLGFLRAMREAGAVRRNVDVRAVAFILDALTPALLRRLAAGRGAATGGPSVAELLEALADLLDRGLTPPRGADLRAAKEVLMSELDHAREGLSSAPSRHRR